MRKNPSEHMDTTKKITKEDTWKPSELRRHIGEKVRDDGYNRRRDDSERKHRSGESTERRHRDPEESRRDKDKLRERRHGDSRDRYVEHGKEGSQDQRDDRKREIRDRRHGRDSERQRVFDDNGGNEDRAADRERHRDRHEDRKRERVRDRERDTEEDKGKRREDRDKERRKEDKEHRSERRRHEDNRKERRDEVEKQHRERRHRDGYEDGKKDRDIQEKQRDRKHSEQREDRVYKEQGRHKEEREKRHRESRHHDDKWKHESETRAHRDLKTSGESFRRSRGDKEREEKDKERRKKEAEDSDRRHKERKHREEEDVEKKHRERTSSKKSSSDGSHRHDKEEETKDVQVVSEHRTADVKEGGATEEHVNRDEDLADQEYEDDFEDYEEDFEESGDEEEKEVDEETEEVTSQRRKEIEAIQRAMAEENERAGTAQSKQSREEEVLPGLSKDPEKNQIQSSKRGKFINFVAAKQREVASKQKKRGTELLRLIDLDFSTTFSLLDLPPVNEYEMYIRSFGNANTKQAYVQCNEDNLDRDIQTEEIDTCEKWTQHPSELSGACGDPNSSQEARDKTRSELNFDSQSLASFLNSASQVMVVLLEEAQAERESLRKPKTQTESRSFSDGSLQLNTKLPFLLGRHISLVHFSQVQRHIMLSVHSPTANVSDVRLDSSTLICIWNIWEPSRPQKILLYESEVQCCCFSPGKSTLVFAGTSVGSVVLWDLREQASNHFCLKIGEDDWTFRQPTFSTDAVMGDSGHFSPVTSVEVVPSTVTGAMSSQVPLLASEEESSGLSFQLASLDESGVLNFWVVLELPKANEAGSPTDLGLRPGGKVKLLPSSSLHTADRASPKDAATTRQALLLKFLPTDSNHFFIGTNLGLVSHGTSHGLKAHPKFYRFQEVEERPVDVSSIHFSPFKPHLFLVGCGDGSIRLHSFSTDQPVAEWRNSTAGEPVVSLQWAQTRPTVFCVLDAASNLYIWDLLKNNTQPTLIERISADRVTVMSVFGDSGQQSRYSGVALAHESGKIQLHYFTRSFTQLNSAEEEKLESLMSEVF